MLRLRELGKRGKKGKVCATLISHRFRKGKQGKPQSGA